MAAWPDSTVYREWSRIDDTLDDGAIEPAIAAVKAAILNRCPILATVEDPDVPAEVAAAVLLWTNRLMARRNSPEGLVGSELGAVNIGRYDPDVGRLLSPYIDPVLA